MSLQGNAQFIACCDLHNFINNKHMTRVTRLAKWCTHPGISDREKMKWIKIKIALAAPLNLDNHSRLEIKVRQNIIIITIMGFFAPRSRVGLHTASCGDKKDKIEGSVLVNRKYEWNKELEKWWFWHVTGSTSKLKSRETKSAD